MPALFIPTQLRSLTAGVAQVEVQAATVRDAVHELDQQFPGIANALLEEGALARGLAVSIDGQITPRGALAPLAGVREVHFLPAIGGG